MLVYDVNTGGIIHTQGGHASAVVGVSLFSGFLISASDDGKIGLLGMVGSRSAWLTTGFILVFSLVVPTRPRTPLSGLRGR